MGGSPFPPPEAVPIADGGFVRLEGVSKRYRDVLALDRVTFAIGRGDVFGYIGPNGAGKTTTIKAIVGLLQDFEGAIEVRGRSVRDRRGEVQRLLGYLPQKAAFQGWRTVEQALMTFGRLSGMSRQDVDRRIPEVLALLGIEAERHRRIVQLSGGTVQKVGMAQAILHEPEFLVLDEPMAGLDPEARYRFKALFRQLRDGGTTIFFSSHILGDVEDVANRVGILSRGRTLHVGTPAELRERLRVPPEIAIVLSHDPGRPMDPAAFPGVVAMTYAGPNRLLARVRDDAGVNDAVRVLIEGLWRHGYGIRSIAPVEPDLEELYVRFVGGAGG